MNLKNTVITLITASVIASCDNNKNYKELIEKKANDAILQTAQYTLEIDKDTLKKYWPSISNELAYNLLSKGNENNRLSNAEIYDHSDSITNYILAQKIKTPEEAVNILKSGNINDTKTLWYILDRFIDQKNIITIITDETFRKIFMKIYLWHKEIQVFDDAFLCLYMNDDIRYNEYQNIINLFIKKVESPMIARKILENNNIKDEYILSCLRKIK